METWTVATLISVGAALSGVILGWLSRSRIVKQDAASEADRDATLRADVAHIRHTIDEMRIEQRAQGLRFDALAERVTRVEESSKQAHHRLNKLEERGG